MWECEYSREPVDYRLIWLRFLRKAWIIPIAAALGAILVGAGYYYARTAARGGRTYQTESVFYVDFGQDAQGEAYDYYNYYTWGDVIRSDFFVDTLCERMQGELTREEILSYISATIESDTRYLYVRCNTHSPELSVRLAAAMEEIVPGFADTRKEIDRIELATAGKQAKDSSKIRMGNAYFLGGCLGFAISLFGILVMLILDTAVWLPYVVEKRYRIPCLGAAFMPEFAANCNYYLKGAERIAGVFVDEDAEDADLFPEGDRKETCVICKNPVTHPEELERIRGCDRVVLCLKAGRKNDESFRRLLEQLNRQEIKVTAVILTAADRRLISAYYREKV